MVSAEQAIPVIDLFAGPGGLGEGFSAFLPDGHSPAFRIRLSIEKDPVAHQTLELRAFFRQFPHGLAPSFYYDHLRGAVTREQLFAFSPRQANAAKAEAWNLTLGAETAKEVRERITQVLDGAERSVLIGGPPCQAYSLAGRSRNRGIEGYVPEDDPKQTLYVEYLQVIADQWPSVFVMENVKGLLSASLKNVRVFDRIIGDLQNPIGALKEHGRPVPARTHHYTVHGYLVHSLNPIVAPALIGQPAIHDYVVRCERHGIPQARHRLILVGVRDDIEGKPGVLRSSTTVTAGDVLENLPRLRSGLSRGEDSPAAWVAAIKSGMGSEWVRQAATIGGAELERLLLKSMKNMQAPPADRGGEYLPWTTKPRQLKDWFVDPRLDGVCNHSARGHMASDLHRYLYAACFAVVKGKSPSLCDFPKELRPAHLNVDTALEGGNFADRFRVQLGDRPSTTVVSHISKDGHYYIHPDPKQCRSLTVREAARLQTFPDNYFFCGNRTQQYHQVGNAVPPLLARQIAEIVYDLLK